MSEKPTLFLLPGLMCDEAVWEHQQAALSPYAEIIIPVFRGFNSFEAMAQFVLDQAPERFSVIGHSMGGRVAMELMLMAGNRIDKFAVMDTGAHGVKAGEKEKRQVLLDLADQLGLQAVADAWTLPMIDPSRHNDEKLIMAISEMILRNSVDDYHGQVQALLNRRDQTEHLSNIEQSVLLVCGESDNWSPVSQHEAMLKELKDGVLEIIPNAGHMSTMEQPEIVNRVLVNWFTNNHA